MKNAKTDIEYGSETPPTQTAGQTKPALTPQCLAEENRAFSGTGGISQENHTHGFVPGYLDRESGEVAVSRFANGEPAPVHLLEGLPEGWIQARSTNGEVLQVKGSIIAGFILNGRFYTRKQAAKALTQVH
jgi:hypothetical protein